MEIVSLATSVANDDYTVENMLAGTYVWETNGSLKHQEESVVFKVPDGSVVSGFDIASGSEKFEEMRIEEVTMDGSIGGELFGWNHCGTFSGDSIYPCNYTPASIEVTTTATRFKVSVRHTGSGSSDIAGVAIFRAVGIAAECV